MKYIDEPIGSVFTEGEMTLKVVESKDNGVSCRGCFYNSWQTINGKAVSRYPYGCYVHRHACTPANRKDNKQVLFMIAK